MYVCMKEREREREIPFFIFLCIKNPTRRMYERERYIAQYVYTSYTYIYIYIYIKQFSISVNFFTVKSDDRVYKKI